MYKIINYIWVETSIMETPTDLSHKPIVHVKGYFEKDGQFSNDTDAQALSIGFAQWDKHLELEERDISLKVWRYVQDHGWSRQSEELPLHRVVDLNILMLAALLKDPSSSASVSNLGETVLDADHFEYIYKYYQHNKRKREIDQRILELSRLLKKFIEKEGLK